MMSEELNISDDERKEVEKAIGEPFMDDFSENTLRIRRNLIVAASITLILKLGKLEIGSSISASGLTVKNVSPEKIDFILFVILIYLVIHFFWNSINNFQEWRLRLSVSKVAFMTASKYSGVYEDAPNDPHQSTLFYYLLGKRKGSLTDTHNQLANAVSKLSDNENTNKIQQLEEIKRRADQINDNLKFLNRIPVSLSRFEKHFKLFHWSQSARWIVLEWALPILLGLWAIYLVFPFC